MVEWQWSRRWSETACLQYQCVYGNVSRAFGRDSESKCVGFFFLHYYCILNIMLWWHWHVQWCSSHSHWTAQCTFSTNANGLSRIYSADLSKSRSEHTYLRCGLHFNGRQQSSTIGFPWTTPMRNFLHGRHLYRTNSDHTQHKNRRIPTKLRQTDQTESHTRTKLLTLTCTWKCTRSKMKTPKKSAHKLAALVNCRIILCMILIYRRRLRMFAQAHCPQFGWHETRKTFSARTHFTYWWIWRRMPNSSVSAEREQATGIAKMWSKKWSWRSASMKMRQRHSNDARIQAKHLYLT